MPTELKDEQELARRKGGLLVEGPHEGMLGREDSTVPEGVMLFGLLVRC